MSSPSQAERDSIAALKQQVPHTGLVDREGAPCKFKILGRGELGFFQRGERGLLFELLAGHGVVFAGSIRVWDDGAEVSEAEREQIIEIASRHLRELGVEHVEVVRS